MRSDGFKQQVADISIGHKHLLGVHELVERATYHRVCVCRYTKQRQDVVNIATNKAS